MLLLVHGVLSAIGMVATTPLAELLVAIRRWRLVVVVVILATALVIVVNVSATIVVTVTAAGMHGFAVFFAVSVASVAIVGAVVVSAVTVA